MLVATLLLLPLRRFSARPAARRWSKESADRAAPKKLFVPEFRRDPRLSLASNHRGIFYLRCPGIIIERTRAIVAYVCVITGREKHIEEKFMRGRNEQPNRTKWTYLASPRINKQQQMTAYVRPFLRHRFHRSGSRSVKDSSYLPLRVSPRLYLAFPLASTRTGIPFERASLFFPLLLQPRSVSFVLTLILDRPRWFSRRLLDSPWIICATIVTDLPSYPELSSRHGHRTFARSVPCLHIYIFIRTVIASIFKPGY